MALLILQASTVKAELAAHIVQPSHQERTLVHPLLDGSEGMLDALAPPIENVGPGVEAHAHAVEDRLVLISQQD
ncbi:hypothetical protein [Chelatococcus asaccharovorans]|jgi:hypothetical protein|nr:hypothetical protein [Chelatococcus asaccharovorans]MBS7708068.1 hypothetical protein [Chelatococcus asaccharovorans]